MTDEQKFWFKCFPSKWLGALQIMPPHIALTYIVVCLRIYENDGPCKDNEAALALRTHLSKKKILEAIEWLIKNKKLDRSEAGFMNPFAAEVLADRDAPHDRRSVGEEKSRCLMCIFT